MIVPTGTIGRLGGSRSPRGGGHLPAWVDTGISRTSRSGVQTPGRSRLEPHLYAIVVLVTCAACSNQGIIRPTTESSWARTLIFGAAYLLLLSP